MLKHGLVMRKGSVNMSLANLIKNAKRAEGRPSVLQAIDRHYNAQARYIDMERTLDRMSRFQPSSISYQGACPRQYSLFMNREEFDLEVEPVVKFGADMMRVFDHGHAIHATYQDKILGPAGILYGRWKNGDQEVEGFRPHGEDWEYVEPRIVWPEKRISGYCDGLVFVDGRWAVLEIKSANSNSFGWIKNTNRPRDYHVRQAQLYIFAPKKIEKPMKIEGCIILYYNKDTGEEMEFYVEADESMLADMYQQIDDAIYAAENALLPPRLEDCKTPKSKRAKECAMCKACFSEKINAICQ